MPRMVKAAVLHHLHDPLVIEEVELQDPTAGQILVKMGAAGICHSDVHGIDGTLPVPFPIVLGHEGAGIAEEVGPGVSMIKPGDRVVLSAFPSCGTCLPCLKGQPYYCQAFLPALFGGTLIDGSVRLKSKDGTPIYHGFCQSSFAEYAVVSERQAVKIGDTIPLSLAALLACGVSTGLAAVFNLARVKPGSSVAVFGCGGVGLSVVMGARIAGAGTIIAVDILENKLRTAHDLGATHTINSSKDNAVDRIRQISETGGVDYAFEAVGIAELVAQSVDVLQTGGVAIKLGSLPAGSKICVDAMSLGSGRTVTSTPGGMSLPHMDIPRFVDMFNAGKLPLDKLLTSSYRLAEINDAIEDLGNGKLARSVIQF